MTRGKDFGRGVYVGLLVEESPDVPCERPIIRLPTCIQRGRRLAVCLAYRLPAGFAFGDKGRKIGPTRSEEHTSELQSLMPISYAVFCLQKNTAYTHHVPSHNHEQ